MSLFTKCYRAIVTVTAWVAPTVLDIVVVGISSFTPAATPISLGTPLNAGPPWG